MLESNSQEDPDYQNKTQSRRAPAESVVHRSPLDGESNAIVWSELWNFEYFRSFTRDACFIGWFYLRANASLFIKTLATCK